MRRNRGLPVVAVVVLSVVLAACGIVSGSHIEDRLHTALENAGEQAEADNLARYNSNVQIIESPLEDWVLVQLDGYMVDGQDMGLDFYGIGPEEELIRISNSSKLFRKVVDADGMTLATADEAEAFTRAYLVTTGPIGYWSEVLDSVDQIALWSDAPPDDVAERDRIRAEYRDQIEPPAATQTGDAFEAVAYRLQEDELHRHLITVSINGRFVDDVEVLESEIPAIPHGSH